MPTDKYGIKNKAGLWFTARAHSGVVAPDWTPHYGLAYMYADFSEAVEVARGVGAHQVVKFQDQGEDQVVWEAGA